MGIKITGDRVSNGEITYIAQEIATKDEAAEITLDPTLIAASAAIEVQTGMEDLDTAITAAGATAAAALTAHEADIDIHTPNHHWLPSGYTQADLVALIAAVSAGDVIHIPAGTCNTTSTITLSKALTITSSARNSAIISGNFSGYIFTITTSFVTVENIKLVSVKHGISINSNFVDVNNCILNLTSINSNNGIYLAGNFYCNIQNNYISNCNYGINCNGGRYNRLNNNVIITVTIGLNLAGHDYVISGNIIRTITTFGFEIVGGDENVITGNTFEQNCQINATSIQNVIVGNVIYGTLVDNGADNKIAHNVLI